MQKQQQPWAAAMVVVIGTNHMVPEKLFSDIVKHLTLCPPTKVWHSRK